MTVAAPPIVRVAFLDVGQADTIVVSSPETSEAIVIDCVDADAVLQYLEHERVRHLRAIIITHLHIDHYKEVALLLKNAQLVPGMSACEMVVFNDIPDRARRETLLQDDDQHSALWEGTVGVPPAARSAAYRDLLAWRQANKGQYAELKVQAGSMQFGGQLARSIKVLHPFAADYVALEGTGLNNTSIVLWVSGPGASVLLTGDLEPTGWRQLVTNYPHSDQFRCDVLKFPHHGAWKGADVAEFIDAVQPSVVVISVGTDGERYGHPNAHVFAAIRDRARQHPTRLLCIQATNQCGPAATERDAVVAVYEQELQASGRLPLLLGRNGCPCAGTVQVELGTEVRVLQPDPGFHRDRIILPHFPTHKCLV